MTHDKENIMVILSSPSGVGKTTLTKKIQQKYQNLKYQFHIQQDHQDQMKLMELDYHLFPNEKFEKINANENNEFYEYAKIFGNYYGTLKKM